MTETDKFLDAVKQINRDLAAARPPRPDPKDCIECELCGGHVPCGKYGDAACDTCGQFYEYDEGPHIVLTPEQRELLRDSREVKT